MKPGRQDLRPRVAHVLPWAAVGGTELGALRIAEAVRDRFDSVAFCVPAAVPVRDIFRGSGFETAQYRPVEPSLRQLPAFAASTLALALAFRRRRIAVVHCADLLAGYHAAAAGRLAGIPVVCHIRCTFERVAPRDAWFLRPIDRFVFVSRHTWEAFGYRVPAESSRVIYDGLPAASTRSSPARIADVRTALGIPTGSRVVGMIARVAPAKDFPTLIRAAGRIAAEEPDVRFLVVGDNSSAGEYREHFARVEAWLAEAGLRDRFVFSGHRTDISELLDAMDVFVLCSHTEGMPLVVLEAMARGKPVLATAVGGIPELIEHGRSGCLHAHEDHAAAAEQLLALLRDSGRASTLAESAREHIREHFSVERFTSSLLSLYSELLGVADLSGSTLKKTARTIGTDVSHSAPASGSSSVGRATEFAAVPNTRRVRGSMTGAALHHRYQ
jgi:glycosyltransferase involved in cell wall biosynthesis